MLGSASINTQRAYRSSLAKFQRHLDGAGPDQAAARDFYAQLVGSGLKPASLERHVAALRWLFVEVIQEPPPRFPKISRQQDEPRFLTRDEVTACLRACADPLERAVLSVGYGAGLRASELLGLTWEDPDPDGYLRVRGKGNRQETVPVPMEMLMALAALPKKRGSAGPFAFSYSKLRGILNRVADRAGVGRFSPHALRHSYVTHSLWAGAAVQDVSRAVRHSRLETTMRYTHIKPLELKARLPNLLSESKAI